ncbi:MAG: helix-turn-helix domain-containing protein, partial [Wenzhouxiangella sp.]|nr:helix-turn-helix domain-containing protein [Wenzhouxiangella sp.]
MIETPKSKQLGAALYLARQAKGWSVAEVAERIGASVSLVASLERDAGAELAPVYRDGFLRRYLHLVGMDEEVAPTAPPPAIRPILTGVRGIRKNHWINASFSWLRYALVSVVIVAPMLWFGINHSVLWLTDGLEATPEGSERAAKANSERRQVRIIRASQLPPRGQSQSQP